MMYTVLWFRPSPMRKLSGFTSRWMKLCVCVLFVGGGGGVNE